MTESYLHLKSNNEAVHFYHANGFPAGVYTPFLDSLNQKYEVFALNSRATWPNAGVPTHNDWQIYADDLIAFIEKLGKPIIAIGHSMGASGTVLAATKRPELFKALVLVEPAMLTLPLAMIFKLTPKRYIRDLKLVKGTANKPDTWKTREDFSKYVRKFKGYNKFSAEAYDAFTEHAVSKNHEHQEEVTLKFHKSWEAHNYTMPPYLMNHFKILEKINMPTVAIRGQKNMFFPHSLWGAWKKKQPSAIFLEDKNFTHLFPLEGPNECMTLIQEGLKKLGIQVP